MGAPDPPLVRRAWANGIRAMEENPEVLFEKESSLAWLTFNRPRSRNALTLSMYDRLSEICDTVEGDSQTRVLILKGAGEEAFAAGTDIGTFRSFRNPQHALDYERRLDSVMDRLESLLLPTIAMVRGYAVGGGARIAFSCDLRIVSPDARFGIPIARTLGNCLSTAGYSRLIDLLGPARTKELLFTGRMVDAREALSIGIVNEIVKSDQLEARVREVATLIASNSPLTIQVTKEVVRSILRQRQPAEDSDMILKCYMSEDFAEGVKAFLEKRKPRWRGR